MKRIGRAAHHGERWLCLSCETIILFEQYKGIRNDDSRAPIACPACGAVEEPPLTPTEKPLLSKR
mgnify:CR=1 FL=1